MQGEWLRKPAGQTSVIFVHGILSSGESCWRHESGAYWPALLKNEPELEHIGIYVFTYETGIFSGSYSLGDTVDALKEHMRLDDLFASRCLIFVCHSMGGIVVRRLLVQRAMEFAAAHTVIGLFLVSSPTLGAAYADWLAPIARLFGHRQADILRFVRNNEWLNDLDKDFLNLKEARSLLMQGKELVEDKFIVFKNLPLQQVVEPFSGARYFGEPFKVPGSDHFSIAKPCDRRAIQHRLLVKFIKGMVKPDRNDANDASSLLVVNILDQSVEALHYAPRQAEVRFTVTNLSSDTIKIMQLVLNVKRREAIRLFRLPMWGAPCSEFELEADISEMDTTDLLAAARAQFVVKAGDTDAFSLTVTACEGFLYDAELVCSGESLSTPGVLFQSAAALKLTYPTRTLGGLHGGK
ncbi:alpha/beta hydrolase [bacterium]|nr:alpha/beta hydrolase [bacterium]